MTKPQEPFHGSDLRSHGRPPPQPPENDNDLLTEFSAQVWAERFVQRVTHKPTIATDVGTMIAWFAGAIMAGYYHGNRETDSGEQTRPIPNDGPCIQDLIMELLGQHEINPMIDSEWARPTAHAIRYIERRKQVGVERYGVALQPNNGRNAARDAFEEAVDLVMYMAQWCIEEKGELVFDKSWRLGVVLDRAVINMVTIAGAILERDGRLP